MNPRAAFALLLLAASARADIPIEKETYRVLGWNDACSVAVERLAYPKLGAAIHGEPVTTRVGTLTIEPGQDASATTWHLEADGARSWNETALREVEEELKKAGYEREGYSELIREEPPADVPGVREVILSTKTLRARVASWPGPEWRWGGAHYDPLGTCALLVWEKKGAYTRYLIRLARIDNTRARFDRAMAHMGNALVLFDRGDPESTLAEASIAARLAPEKAACRYHHARALALTGELEKAYDEVKAAIDLDHRYKEKALAERDLEDLRGRPDFKALTATAR